MAARSGRNGQLKIDLETSFGSADAATAAGSQAALLYLRSWSIDANANIQTVDTAAMGNFDDWTQAYTLSRSWSASFTVLWDSADGAMDDLEVGWAIAFTCYPDSTETASSFVGTGVISQLTSSSSYDGLIEVSFTVVGNGALTTSD